MEQLGVAFTWGCKCTNGYLGCFALQRSNSAQMEQKTGNDLRARPFGAEKSKSG